MESVICPKCRTQLLLDNRVIKSYRIQCTNCGNVFENPFRQTQINLTKKQRNWLIGIAVVIVLVIIGNLADNDSSSSSTSTRSEIKLIKQQYVGRTYNMDLADELYEKYGYPQTLNGTNNKIWIVYYPKGDFTLSLTKHNQYVFDIERGRKPLY